MNQALEREFARMGKASGEVNPEKKVLKNEFDVYLTPSQEKKYLEGKPVVIMKQMHDMYNKLYLEKHRSKSLMESTTGIMGRNEDIEQRMRQYVENNFDALDAVEIPEGDDDAAWDKMFDAYKTKTHQNTEEAWNQIIHQYQRTHDEEEELPFKTIGELI